MKISNFGLILRGMAMGMAEIIPGVSGGTIAFITGIYKRLLDAITSVDLDLLSLLRKGKWNRAWRKMDATFLCILLSGMAGGLVFGIFTISFMLEEYPEIIWALFFGLILASVPYMISQLNRLSLTGIMVFVTGAIVAYFITSLVPAEGSHELWYIFMGGTIAISALVLPGISGSFILLLLGLYSFIIPTLKGFLSEPDMDAALIIGVFALGCLTGLLMFSRLISRAFEKYHDTTIALLSGFMLGSLNKIWPWRNVSRVMDEETGRMLVPMTEDLANMPDHYKIISENNVLPDHYAGEPRVLWVIFAMAAGILIIYWLSRIQKRVYTEG